MTKPRIIIPPLEQELILAHILKKSREYILTHPEIELTNVQKRQFEKLIDRRKNHEPLAYILGHNEFYGLDFKVNRNTLIPRPETEHLVEEVLNLNPKDKIIIDIGTGSGNIIITLAKNINNKNYYFGADISPEALNVSRYNAKKNKADKKIKFIKSDLLGSKKLLSEIKNKDLIITANLPYLDKDWKNLLKSSDSAGLKFEPQIALDGGSDGLDLYRKLAEGILKLKEKNQERKIFLFCEIGHLQKSGMKKIFHFAQNINFKKDLAGKWRVAIVEI